MSGYEISKDLKLIIPKPPRFFAELEASTEDVKPVVSEEFVGNSGSDDFGEQEDDGAWRTRQDSDDDESFRNHDTKFIVFAEKYNTTSQAKSRRERSPSIEIIEESIGNYHGGRNEATAPVSPASTVSIPSQEYEPRKLVDSLNLKPVIRIVPLPIPKLETPPETGLYDAPEPVPSREAVTKKVTTKPTRKGRGKKRAKKTSPNKGRTAGTKEDTQKLYCVCKRPHGNRHMVECVHCREWYHFTCVGLHKSEANRLESVDWFCRNCQQDEDLSVTFWEMQDQPAVVLRYSDNAETTENSHMEIQSNQAVSALSSPGGDDEGLSRTDPVEGIPEQEKYILSDLREKSSSNFQRKKKNGAKKCKDTGHTSVTDGGNRNTQRTKSRSPKSQSKSPKKRRLDATKHAHLNSVVQDTSVAAQEDNHFRRLSVNSFESEQLEPTENGQETALKDSGMAMEEPGAFIGPQADITTWTVKHVVEYLQSVPELEKYAAKFESQEVDGKALTLLELDHFINYMKIPLGPAVKLADQIKAMKGADE